MAGRHHAGLRQLAQLRGRLTPVAKPCRHADPLQGFSYCGAFERAEKLQGDGWKQKKCAVCHSFFWVKPTRLERLIAIERRLVADYKKIMTQAAKLEDRLHVVRAKILSTMDER